MSGTWYPSLREQIEAEVQPLAPHWTSNPEEDWEAALHELAAEGDIDALLALRRELSPIDYQELGWGD